ncbi:MAG: phenylalanine--tRNA ligase subunit beta [Planctomycetota bacterium]
MDISLAWLNHYLEPHTVTADEADEVLTHAGFPIEERKDPAHGKPNGDVVLDVEVTSNRGDCLSHLGCAREIAASPRAAESRRLVYPVFEEPAKSGSAAAFLSLRNETPAVCPLFTARVIRGCRVGPSPSWLAERLEAVGQRAINNIVDVTNYLTLEFGNPCHVFDLGKLAGGQLVVRYARAGEVLRTLDDKERKLAAEDLVVADAERPQSLAGVIGGADSQVDDGTVDVVFEMATWDPVVVRGSSRRHNVSTDAAYRFQRGIDPRTIELAARRATALICDLTGGTLCEGVLTEGEPMPEAGVVELRLERADAVLGISIPPVEAAELLRGIEIDASPCSDRPGVLRCEIPPHRSRDLTREIDLIEELVRVKGYDAVPVAASASVVIRAPQARRRAITELGRVLTGLGFDETVTFSFTRPERGSMFLGPGCETVSVDDDRRKEEPTLRPSPLTGLLACRKANQDARSAAPGVVRLFEIASSFAQAAETRESQEQQVLCLLIDVPGAEGSTTRSADDIQAGVRVMRGVLDVLARSMHGPAAKVDVRSSDAVSPGFDAAVFGGVSLASTAGVGSGTGLGGFGLGCFGLASRDAMASFGLELPVIMAEIPLDALVGGYPPASRAHPLPSFPAIDRDVSLIVDEGIAWAEIEDTVDGLGLDRFADVGFIGVFRGKQIGSGKKSVTMRLRFRDSERTLRHEEVDPQVDAVINAARKRFQAEIRG